MDALERYLTILSEETAAQIDQLQAVVTAARDLQTRLDEHFGGYVDESDWKEQAELRAALAALEQETKK